MKTSIKMVLAFTSGAVLSPILIAILLGSVSFEYMPNESGFGIENSFTRERFSDVCSYLEENECGCYPVLRTDTNCKDMLQKYMYKKMGEH